MRYLDIGTTPKISKIGLGTQRAAECVEQLESNVAAAEIELPDDEYAALSAASDRFQPVTGRAAVPAMIRARLRP
jgi:hypothetical protein